MRRRFRALGAILVCSTLLTGCWPFKKKKSTPGGGTSRAAPGPANLAVTGASSKDSTWNLYLIRPDGEGLTQLTDGARWSYV